MVTDEVKKYISIRYDRWHDYAAYHCAQAGIGDESVDVLNEVLCSLLQMSPERLTKMHDKVSGKYRELDWYVLRMIKLNATSPTSPYQHRYKPMPVDANVDFARVEIEDEAYEDEDAPGEIVQKTRIVREILSELMINDHAREVFEYRFFLGEIFKDWPGPENEKELFDTYYKVVNLIKEKLNGNTLF